MKANEAPEKIYVALNEIDEDERTFVLDHRTDYPICTEYTRTDAFIEKACVWLNKNTGFFSEKEFRKAMKGE